MTNREKLIKEISEKADNSELADTYLSVIGYDCEDCIADFDCDGTCDGTSCQSVVLDWLKKGDK